MNDIEILEKLINSKLDYCSYINSTEVLNEKEKQALENLIKRNKQLEETLKDEIQCFNKMKDIAETLRKENVEYIIQNKQYELNYISKSKVREIIQKYYDEYEKQKEYRYILDVEDEQKVLIKIKQELLQEGDK